MLVVLVYVDDIIITGSSAKLIHSFIHSLQKLFLVKDLGQLHYFLGIEVNPTPTCLHLSQFKYLKDVLTRANMLDANLLPSPMCPGTTLSKLDGDPFNDLHLLPLDCRCSTICHTYPTRHCLFGQQSVAIHASTIHYALGSREAYSSISQRHRFTWYYPSSSYISLSLYAYSDTDWAGSPDDRKSTAGFCVFLGSNIISWGSKKQPTVARSSTESEYKFLAITSSELVWLQYLLAELHVILTFPPILWCDNLGATYLASNPLINARTKHVEIDYHFVRDRVANNSLQIQFISTKDQLTDIFTKPLAAPRFGLRG